MRKKQTRYNGMLLVQVFVYLLLMVTLCNASRGGPDTTDLYVGNPVNAATGNKFEGNLRDVLQNFKHS